VKLPIVKNPEPWITVRGKIVDENGNPIDAKIIYERLPDGKEVGIAQTNPKTGEYEIRLPGGHQYGVRAEAKDKISESQNLDLTGITADKVIDQKDFQLEAIKVTPIAENITITLNNVFFDFDKSVLKVESFPELNRIAKLLKERATMEIELDGHTDAVGSDDYNLNLSERRAKAVAKYLVDQGVAEERVKVMYFGESKPVDDNATREGRKKNRRVEFKINKT
jgi:outer membrane protein OmpA-like peptidoglycan-associated protein